MSQALRFRPNAGRRGSWDCGVIAFMHDATLLQVRLPDCFGFDPAAVQGSKTRLKDGPTRLWAHALDMRVPPVDLSVIRLTLAVVASADGVFEAPSPACGQVVAGINHDPTGMPRAVAICCLALATWLSAGSPYFVSPLAGA